MSIPLLNKNVLQCFAEFVALYLGDAPDPEDIKEYVENISNKKGIVESYENKLITQDEVSYVLLGHIYTEYVLNQDEVHEVGDNEIERIRRKIVMLLFG